MHACRDPEACLHGRPEDAVDHGSDDGHRALVAGPQEVHCVHRRCHHGATRHRFGGQARTDVDPAQHLQGIQGCSALCSLSTSAAGASTREARPEQISVQLSTCEEQTMLITLRASPL